MNDDELVTWTTPGLLFLVLAIAVCSVLLVAGLTVSVAGLAVGYEYAFEPAYAYMTATTPRRTFFAAASAFVSVFLATVSMGFSITGRQEAAIFSAILYFGSLFVAIPAVMAALNG